MSRQAIVNELEAALGELLEDRGDRDRTLRAMWRALDELRREPLAVNRVSPRGPQVKVRLAPGAELPSYQTEGAAGLDLACHYPCQLLVLPLHKSPPIPTGVHLQIPPGWEATVRPRSSMNNRAAVVLIGTVDSDYRGEVHVSVINLGMKALELSPGDRIAQLVFSLAPQAQLLEVKELEPTARGEGRFGSTGK